MSLAARHVLAHLRSGATLEQLLERGDPCAMRLKWADLQDIRAELEADVNRAIAAAGLN